MQVKIQDIYKHIYFQGWECHWIPDRKQYNKPWCRQRGIKGFDAYVKGLKKILKDCHNIGFFDGAAAAYCGRPIEPETYIKDKFRKVIGQLSDEAIINIANGTLRWSTVNYVTGDFSVNLEER